MGLIDGLLGNASRIDAAEVREEFREILVHGEDVERAYQVIRDTWVFTNRRLLLVDRQGLSGKKVEYHSVPYGRITHFSIETAGTFDRDAELRLWLSGGTVIEKTFNKKLDVREVQRVLAAHVL
jgi:hypothetical protein